MKRQPTSEQHSNNRMVSVLFTEIERELKPATISRPGWRKRFCNLSFRGLQGMAGLLAARMVLPKGFDNRKRRKAAANARRSILEVLGFAPDGLTAAEIAYILPEIPSRDHLKPLLDQLLREEKIRAASVTTRQNPLPKELTFWRADLAPFKRR
ncbi:MAG: hypothetical protein HQL72_09215 [Magnetococcales bacterium]|nr:hypothetical protein [Magnetococcales bacterium]